MNVKHLGAVLVVILAAAYVIWTFDIIPDFIPIIGWIDDLIAIGIGALAIKRLL